MESVEVEIEETVEETVECEECVCKPFTVVRYRDARQEDSYVDDVFEGNVMEGVFALTDEAGKFLFAAPLDTILSVQQYK